jgi:hypothetical protein
MALSSRAGRAERTIQVLRQTSPRHYLSEKAESCYEWMFGRRRSDAAAMGEERPDRKNGIPSFRSRNTLIFLNPDE